MLFAKSLACLGLVASSAVAASLPTDHIQVAKRGGLITPKVFIISMFSPESDIWTGIPEFDLDAQVFPVPGFSPLYPDARCTADGDVCNLITGESEINAAVTIASLVRSPFFDLRHTYFFIGGIAGVNPEVATTGSVMFARYAVQVALQYEIDPRELAANWSTGYVPQGSVLPDEYPQSIYGTEVFEVSDALRKLAVGFASKAALNDSATAAAYRANYASTAAFAAGAAAPSVVECDVATSDVYFSGNILGATFTNFTALVTNGTGVYCATAQEDNATLEALLRAAADGLVDFARVIVMRTASDFDRPYAGEEATYNLFYSDNGGYDIAIENIYLAGVEVVTGILDAWNSTFGRGVELENYVGDILNTLGGDPDYGLAADYDEPVKVERRSRVSAKGRGMRRRA